MALIRPLNYARLPSTRQRRWGLLAAVSVATAGAISSMWWEPLLMQRVRATANRAQCLQYSAPANQVVFEEDASCLCQLAALPGYETTQDGRVRFVPAPWRREVDAYRSEGTAFLHQRISRSGNRRLIGIDVIVQPGIWLESTGNIDDLTLAGTVIDPGVGLLADRVVTRASTLMWIEPKTPQPMRFFAGQVDPIDASHFTIEFERASQRGIIDGYLDDDDTLALKPRVGTVTRVHPPQVWVPDAP